MTLANNLDTIQDSTRRFLDRQHGLAINGQIVEGKGSDQIAVLDPSSGTQIACVPAGTEADVDSAVQAAKTAMEEGEWSAMRPHEREQLMHRLASLIDDKAEQIAEIEALESGRKIGDTRAVDAEFSAHLLRYMAGWPTKITGQTIPVSTPYLPPEMRFSAYTTREPIGVVAAVTPWNVPLGIATWKVAPAIAAGCSVVLKPADPTPLTALLLAELAVEAGFPPGVLNVVTGTGLEAGEPLVTHPDVAKVSFTGSTKVGERIGELAGRALKSVTLELGGKSPVVIMPDANLEAAIPAAAGAIFANQGQNCCAGSRLYVHRDVYQRVIDGVVSIAKSLKLGPNLLEDSDIGPLVSAVQQSRVRGYIEAGVKAGADVVAGGGAPDHPGFFVEPTVIVGVNSEMSIVQEEIFGPVLVAQEFDSLDEAIFLANASDYGLGASIFTQDIDSAQVFCQKVDAGNVWVNIHNVLDAGMPFGGFKRSGLGNDLGKDAVLAHTRQKSNYLALGGC